MAFPTKRCSKCKTTQASNNFDKNRQNRDGLHGWCKGCCKASRERMKERLTEYQREYRAKHKEELAQYRRNNAARMKEYNKAHLSEQKEWIKKKRESDPSFRLACRLRGSLWSALTRSQCPKRARILDLLGTDMGMFRQWLEFQFEPWMSWDNSNEWHIDHVLPVSRFNLADESQQRVCFHWSNMRPMCAKANNAKKNAIVLHDFFNTFVSAHRFIRKQGMGNQEYQALRESLVWLRATI
jgi:hypothetical protein